MEMTRMKHSNSFMGLVLAIFVLLGTACQALGGSNPSATLEANTGAFIASATALEMSANANGTQIMATTQPIQTQIAQVNTVNQHLLATVIAGTSPTPRVIVGNADPSTTGATMDNMGQTDQTQTGTSGGATTGTQFTQIATAFSVRESDGCASQFQSEFSIDTSRIYLTAYATNLVAGTQIDADWRFNGTSMVTTSWTVDQNYVDLCVWFFISPEDTTFSPGNWAAQLIVNTVPVEPAASFTIVGQ
jgi:hypothetical protein